PHGPPPRRDLLEVEPPPNRADPAPGAGERAPKPPHRRPRRPGHGRGRAFFEAFQADDSPRDRARSPRPDPAGGVLPERRAGSDLLRPRAGPQKVPAPREA